MSSRRKPTSGKLRIKKARDAGATNTAEALTMLYCPQGHRLPHHTGKGQCTAIYCADPTSKRGITAEERKVEDALVADETAHPEDAETTRIALAQRRLEAKLRKLGVPETEDPAAIEEWADKRMVQMLKKAVAEVDARLSWGDDDQRWEAAQQVLSSTGRKSRETGVGGSSPIIIINGTGGSAGDLPWIQRMAPIGTAEVKALAKTETKK